jgi:hypothetical protein
MRTHLVLAITVIAAARAIAAPTAFVEEGPEFAGNRGRLVAIDLARNAIVGMTPQSYFFRSATTDRTGSTMYVSTGPYPQSGDLLRVDTQTLQISVAAPDIGDIDGMVIDPAGTSAWVGTSFGIRHVDLATGLWTTVYPSSGSSPFDLDLTAAGDR